MENKIKELRVTLDGLTQLTENLKPIKVPTPIFIEEREEGTEEKTGNFSGITAVWTSKNSIEIEDAVKALKLSKMWLGKILKELGTANPYPESKNSANEQIEPTADTTKNLTVNVDGGWEEMSHIQKVKYLRAKIEKIEDALRFNLDLKGYLVDNITSIGMSMYESSILSCIEAGMWLGMELAAIRDKVVVNPIEHEQSK